MNSDIAIRVESLGKKYLIGHQNTERGTTFREALVQGTRNLARMGRDMLRGRALVGGDSVEDFWALRDLNFEINRGEVVGVIGRNGAGKSTLLKILSRITEPSTGRVAINGRVASLLEVGTGFHPELTGRENIYLNGAILGMKRKEISRKFDEIVDFAGVEKFLDTPVKRYSSGMFVRLAFAVAAHLEPEILIVDEVLAVGDAEFQRKCIGKMQSVANGGRTVVFVSHDQSAILALCTRCMLFSDGKMQATGTPSECISLYNKRKESNGTLSYVGRQGRLDIEITSVKVAFEDFAATGGSLAVKISFCPRTAKASASRVTEVGLSIWKPDGTKIVSISTAHSMAAMPDTNHCIAVCRIPSIPLVAGTYQLNVFINSEHGLEDYVLSAAEISLGSGNIFGTGKSVDPNWGLIAVPHSWQFH